MEKSKRVLALFIAMLMLFSCVQGGVFTAMAVLVQGGVVIEASRIARHG